MQFKGKRKDDKSGRKEEKEIKRRGEDREREKRRRRNLQDGEN